MNTGEQSSASGPALYGRIRVHAHAVWRGPQGITMQDLGGTPFYGWPVLALEKRAGQVDRVEARAVYGHLYNSEREFAVLRAVYWDGAEVRKSILEQGQGFKLFMPSRFVQVPIDRVRIWLSEFEGLCVLVDESVEDRMQEIRRIRIEMDYISRVFEKIWQSQTSSNSILNEKWENVWKEMTYILENGTILTDFDEDFWLARPTFMYDFQSYHPG